MSKATQAGLQRPAAAWWVVTQNEDVQVLEGATRPSTEVAAGERMKQARGPFTSREQADFIASQLASRTWAALASGPRLTSTIVSTRVHVIWHPAKGLDFQVVFHVPGLVMDPNNAGIQAIITALNAVTRAVAIEIALSAVYAPTSSASTGVPFMSIDKAFFTAVDANGSSHNFKIPGLDSNILESDDETIDFTNSYVLAYSTAVTTYALSPGGQAIVSLLSGRRTTNRKPIKNAGVLVVS